MISNPRYDIILKLLEDLPRIFAELLGFKLSDALAEIQDYYNEWLGLDNEKLLDHSPESLLSFLVDEKQFTPDRLELFAQLLGKEAELLIQNKQTSDGKDQIQKALFIFDYVEEHSKVFSSERRATIKELNKLLSN